MKKTLELTRTIIYLVMCAIFTFLVYAYLSTIFMKSATTWPFSLLVILLIIIIDYFSRLKVKNLFVFFGIHLTLMAFTVLVPWVMFDKIILTTISLAFFLMAANFWQIEANERTLIMINVPLGAIIIFMIAYIHSSFSSLTLVNYLKNYSYFGGIVFFLLYFVRDYLDKFYAYTLSSENYSDEVKRTFSTNISLIAFFNSIVIFGILTVNMFFSNSSFNFIGRFFKWIFRMLFGLLPGVNDTTPSDSSNMNYEIETKEGITDFAPHSTTNSGTNIGTLIFNVFQVIVFVGIIIGVLFALYSFIKQYLHRNQNGNDIIKTATKEEIKKVKIEASKTNEKKSIFLSNREKVRRMFLKKVDKATKADESIVLRRSFTPKQIDYLLVKNEAVAKEDMDILTSFYEKARYSHHEITKDDVECLKKLQH